ncbi:hypothetical protein B0A48_02677 [Cryoendolithus antarcticus]|uniref:Uncharacterized protein n=1 Tax=Cryoendolithus antarcticus TaxID=1507870 RepID=A0A1V8TLC3_9PEZI|nr:hypothetical protein B0A48_02677 [Cryoendolithus antarcticus]
MSDIFATLAPLPTLGLPILTASHTTLAPLPTATIVIKVGASTFDAGDADFFGFKPLWHQVCDGIGCDSGTNVEFTGNINSVGNQATTTGSFKMAGFINEDEALTTNLLNAMEDALLKTQKCKTTKGKKCAFGKKKGKRDSGPELHDCIDETLNECTYANFIQATVFAPGTGADQGHLEMSATGGENGAFDCDTVFGILDGAASAFDVGPISGAGITIGQVVCNSIFS